jgi:hypothetical protein
MKYPEYVAVSGTVLKEHTEWLNRESIRRALPKSALLREAIELLMKKYRHVEHPDVDGEETGKNEGYLVHESSEA